VSIELPLGYSQSQWKRSCKQASAELLATGLRYEQVDLSWNTDPNELQHTWAVTIIDPKTHRPHRKLLPEKRETELRKAVMGALKLDWRKRVGTYKEPPKPPERNPFDRDEQSDSEDEPTASAGAGATEGGRPKDAKSFKQMEKELRKRLEAASDEEKSRMFFTAMVAQDADMIRRLLAANVNVEAKNKFGMTAMDVARDRERFTALEVYDDTTRRMKRKKGPAKAAGGEVRMAFLAFLSFSVCC